MSSVHTGIPSRLGPVRQTYARREDFPHVARAFVEVSRVVRETGLMQRTPRFYTLIAAGLAVAFGGAITGFILLGDSWFQLLIAAVFGILFTQVAFLAHEAAHRQILASGPGNDRLARVLAAVVGMSYSWWDSKHSRHHANPNRVGKDPDIEVDTISFLDEDAAQAPDARLDFFSKQVHTSRNICGGWWATWLMGGLNYQVEHHLFPNMSRMHLAQASEIVREFCATHGVPYTETSLWRSYAIVIDYLNRVGLAARDPFDCPLVGQYRRA
ncbi:acyl-CoA desaturase [Microbacterium sp. NPDC089698]|uniref:acyl-CoA desaturase n=1 Tax=Microbacterium sp. NPDC089698 TaxID=3364200 RepID=UPI00382EFA6B